MGRGQELLDAARKGDVRTVTKILALITKRSGPFTSLRRGAGVNVQDDNGYTPLHHACMNGHREIVHLLLSVDASPCVVDKKGATPLHLAAWKGDSVVVSMLLGHCNPPVNIDQKTNDQETALLIAAQFGFVEVVSQLIAKGADVSLRNNKEESPLDLAAQYGKLDVVELLIKAKRQLLDPYRFPISRGRSFPTTPLHRATMNGHTDVVAFLIDVGVDPNIRTENGTALHEGVRYLSHPVVRVLLHKGADLKAVDRMGHSVQALLDTYPEEATRKVKRVIREFENKIKISYESEEDLPAIPVHDYPSPVGGYVNAYGIRVLPMPGTNPDASTNTNIKKRVFNYHHSLKNNSLPSTKIKRSFSSKINKTRSEYYSPTKEELPSMPESSELQPSYVNFEDILSEETEAKVVVPNNDCQIYGNIDPHTVLKEEEIDYNFDSLAGSQNSLKKKPKPPPKPLNQLQKSNFTLNELLQKLGTKNVNVSPTIKVVVHTVENKTDVDGAVKSSTTEVYDDHYNIYVNLPDDEKVKRYSDAEFVLMNNKQVMLNGNTDYVQMDDKQRVVKVDADYVLIKDNERTERRPVPNMNYVEKTVKNSVPEEMYSEYIPMGEPGAKKRLSLGSYVPMNANKNLNVDEYVDTDNISMGKETAKKRLSLTDMKPRRGRCDGVHIKGEKGCIYNSDDYLYTYVLNPNVNYGDRSPFIKKKIRGGDMACFCHEEASKSKEVYYSCEEIYVVIDKNQIYNSLSDVSGSQCDKAKSNEVKIDDIPTKIDLTAVQFEPFEKAPNTSVSSEDSASTSSGSRRKRFSSVFKRKIEQAKQLMTDWRAPQTQKNTNTNLSLSVSSSSLTKNHQSFVKKLASKCLGLKAKFNSAPNISNGLALDSDVSAKIPNSDHKSTNTLSIGNSKFFNKILSKKEESGEIICNDEFDTISLDRLGTLNRDSSVNRSNRSCPGFKNSLPNISENAELSDSESVIITEIDCDIAKSQEPNEAINLHAKLTIFEPRERTLRPNHDSETHDSADLVNECYEPCKFSDSEVEKNGENNNNLPKPSPRTNVTIHSNEDGIIYENVSVINKRDPPKPAVRNNVPSKILLDEIQRKALYENISVLNKKVPEESLLDMNLSVKNKEITSKVEKPVISRSSTMSSDSMEDESNLEDILLSEKSKSFRRGDKNALYSIKSEISRTQSNASNVSEFTEASAIENVDCSEELYTTMSGTLPHKTKKDSENKKKVLFRHKTFTNIEVDRNTLNLNITPFDHTEFMKETLAHYHIRGTGHCIYSAPTVEEFIYIFNRETLYSDTPPFTLVPNDKRESYYETAICFCKPKVPKYHKSAEDLLQLPYNEKEENKVTIDVSALRARNEIVSTSFRCFCDSGQCTFHAQKRESPNNLIVKFSAVKKSISTPDITLDTSFSAVNRSSSMKNPSETSKTEIHYAVTNIEDIVLRNKKLETNKPNPESPIYTVMSQPSTLSSGGQYSIKDIAEVISLDSHSEPIDAPICALNSAHLPLRKSTSSEYSGHWTLASSNSNTTVKSDLSFKTCNEDPEEDSDDGTLHSDDESDAETVKSDVSTAKRPWVHSDSFNFGKNGPKVESYAILEEDSNSSDDDKFESPSKIESGISVEGSESSSSGCDEDSGVPMVDAGSLGVASLERDAGCGGVRSGSGRRRWDETEGTSEGDALSISSAASSCAPHHLAHHHDYSKVSPTPPKKPPRRNLSVSPTHANSPSSGYSYELRAHARSQDDLDEIQGAKHYLKHGRSVDQYVDSKLSYSEFEENHNSPRVAPIPNPRPSLKQRPQPVAITAMYENVVIKEQNPRRKLRRNNFGPQNENDEPRMDERVRKYSNQERSSLESLLDDQSINSPSDCERYYDGPRVDIPLSPTHYEQPPTPDHPPPSARQAENSIHERIRPLSQEYKRRSMLREMLRDCQTDTEHLLRAMSVASVASGATDRSGNTDNCVEEYVCDVPFAGLFKGSTTTLDGIGLRPMPAERPKTLRKLKSVYDSSPTEQPAVLSSFSSNGQGTERSVNGCEDEVRRRSNTTSSTHSGDKSLSILSPFDEQEEWAKISEIMASFGSKLVRESVFVSELEQEFTSRLGLSCSESSLSPSVASNLGLWLSGLGLHDYEPLFLESGFDDIDFVNGILDENDLREMGIEESDRQRILESAKQLPLKITEISNNYNNNNISKNQNESVEEWLRNINLEIYSDTFRKHLYVDMDRVRRIWEVELTAVLEIQKAGHRKRILASVSGEHNGPANHMVDINADLNSLKNNIKQLKDDIKEKLPISENLKAVPPPVVPSLAPPGGETLKRSKKNRPAPQPPRPSDLEIRAPSELMVGVPGALKTQWKHQPFVLVTGAVTYVANYLGSTVVKELRGTESTKKSIQKLKKSTKEPRDSPDIILSISYRGVKFLNTITKDLICEHEIRNIHCACQDADDLTHFAYITKDHTTKSHYCHVFRVATMDQATEVILTLGEAFEVAYQMALREQSNRFRITQSQAKTPTHDPMTTSNKEKPSVNHGRSHSITEIKLNGHQLKIAPMPASLSNEDFQSSRNSDGSRSPRTPLLKAPIASTEEL